MIVKARKKAFSTVDYRNGRRMENACAKDFSNMFQKIILPEHGVKVE